ncbi:formylglycine-generating enzyme family protein [Paenibacillus glycinis]|uniref:SUMF1/EgtB/PvdO family nonheme iron enzyme n=1 Tax=Paenibacillus glycinis TaxID=2697035 RepID=A0ABW9XKI6_9BACL|nr:formylglycine-generating enzyme family protein [Paenibacillus glycinis]NBD22979.1 SUMF1/EgtB/PvdO family nonheme iron enzyme [Paenibacillus glycinis]
MNIERKRTPHGPGAHEDQAERNASPRQAAVDRAHAAIGASCCCQAGRGREEGPPAKQARAAFDTRARSGRSPHEGMIRLEGGSFLMGTDDREGFPADGEGPVRPVKLDPFYIAPHAVTNAEFAEFVRDTGYVTEAEAFGWSYVFHLFVAEKAAGDVRGTVQRAPWWRAVEGAGWRCPEGRGSAIGDRMHHPVVHVSWNDAQAFCRWAGKRLPSEAEWEYAARGGLVRKRYPWGDLLKPDGEHRCNIWQGKFPAKNNASDGYEGTAPVDAYAPNGYGLYNMVGNVWEWCSDWFSPSSPLNDPPANPQGPRTGAARSTRGGSYLCHASYCNRYRVAARSSNSPDSSAGNLGFRVAAGEVPARIPTPI